MDFLKKIFILMPEEKNVGKLILALLFYVYVPALAAGLVSGILVATFILAPVAALVGLVCNVYALVGIAKSVLAYMGKDLKDLCCKGE
jgi:hypothetical protein